MVIANIAEDELLSCPFCGARPELETGGAYEDVACVNPLCLVQPTATGVSETSARETWNTRYSDE